MFNRFFWNIGRDHQLSVNGPGRDGIPNFGVSSTVLCPAEPIPGLQQENPSLEHPVQGMKLRCRLTWSQASPGDPAGHRHHTAGP